MKLADLLWIESANRFLNFYGSFWPLDACDSAYDWLMVANVDTGFLNLGGRMLTNWYSVQCAGCLKYHKLVDNLGLIVEYDFREDDVDVNSNSDQVWCV